LEIGRRVLRIAYTGEINRKRSRHLLFGLSDARWPQADAWPAIPSPPMPERIFPGFDEPAFKATFDLTVTVPRRFLAYRICRSRMKFQIGGRMKRVSFERTPVMSTYCSLWLPANSTGSPWRRKERRSGS